MTLVQVVTTEKEAEQDRMEVINDFLIEIAKATHNKFCATETAVSRFEHSRVRAVSYRSASTRRLTPTQSPGGWANLGDDRGIVLLLRACHAHIIHGLPIDKKESWADGIPLIPLGTRLGKVASPKVRQAAIDLGLLSTEVVK